MASIGYATLSIIPSFKGFGPALDRGSSRSMAAAGVTGGHRFGDAAGRSASRSFGSRFTSLLKTGGLLGGLGAAVGVADFIKDSVELEATFSKTMAQIRVATAAPADQMQRLDDLAINLGKDTIFSASDASLAMLELAKNGIRPATIEAGALASALTLAAAGDIDMETAASTMGNALNAFGLKARRAGSVSAALAGAANASSASVDSLAEGLQQSSTVAADAGFSIQETAGALAAFANAGISGSDAGTSLKTMMSRLVPQTDKAQKAMERLGLDFTNSNGEILSMAEIAGQLKDQLGDLSTEERSTALNTLFGSDARRAATVLMKEGTEGLRGYIKATADQGAAERMAKANMEGTAGSIERLKGSWETAKLEFGKSIAPVAADFLDFLADKLDDVAPKLVDFGEWFGKEGVPKIKRFSGFLKDDVVPVIQDAADGAKDLVGFLNDLPKEVKIGGLVGLAALMGAGKLRGGGGGLLGSAGSALGLARPVPVLVTNPGFGAGGLAGAGGKAGAGPKVLTLRNVGRLFIAGAVADGIYEATVGDAFGLDPNTEKDPRDELSPTIKHGGGAFGIGLPSPLEQKKEELAAEAAKEKWDALVVSAQKYKGALDLVGAKKVNPDLRIPNILQEQDRLNSLGDKLDLVGSKKIRPGVELAGVERAHRQIDELDGALAGLASGVSDAFDHVGDLATGRRGRGRFAHSRRRNIGGY